MPKGKKVVSKKVKDKKPSKIKKTPVYRPGSTPADRNDRKRDYFQKDF